jgi:hypothetical protein
MKPKMTKPEYIALLQDAMHANLTARVEYDKQQASGSLRQNLSG